MSPQRSILEPTAAPVNIETLVKDAAEATSRLKSFHFRLEHNVGGTLVGPNLIVTHVNGDIVKPNKLYLEFSGTLGTFALTSRMKSIDDETFMINPLTDRWENISNVLNPMGFFDPSSGISSIMKKIQTPTALSQNKDVIVVTGTLPTAALTPLIGKMYFDTMLDAELSIDMRNLLLTKVIISGPLTLGENSEVVRTITLSEFNEVTDLKHLEKPSEGIE